MTHPPGGGGGSNGGQTGPGRITAAFDRAISHFDAAYDRLMARLGNAIAHGDKVGRADARTSVSDLTAAAFMRGGVDPAELDRNGWPLSAGFTHNPRSSAMRGNPHPQPNPSPGNPAPPPPPR